MASAKNTDTFNFIHCV